MEADGLIDADGLMEADGLTDGDATDEIYTNLAAPGFPDPPREALLLPAVLLGRVLSGLGAVAWAAPPLLPAVVVALVSPPIYPDPPPPAPGPVFPPSPPP